MFLSDLARHLADVPTNLTRGISERASVCVLDALACAYGGRERPWSRQAHAVARANSALAEAPDTDSPVTSATVWTAGGARAGLADAAFANATAAHSLVHEDMHPPSRVHPGTVVVPTVLALAEGHRCSTTTALQAVVAGYEAIARTSDAVTTESFVQRGLRATGVFGPFGAAAAAAHLLGLSHEQTVHALGLATNTTSGICEWAATGTAELFFQAGHAARTGLISTLLAAEGATAADSAVDGNWGLMRALSGGRPAKPLSVVDDQPLAIEEVYFKSHPACAFTQEAIDVAASIAAKIDPEAVENVRVRIYSAAANYPGCDNATALHDSVARQMSLQYAIAATLVDGRFDPARLSSPLDGHIARIASRTCVIADPDLDEGYPKSRQVVIAVEHENSSLVELAGGIEDGSSPGLSHDDVLAKFRTYSDHALDTRSQQRIIDAVWSPANDDAATWIRTLV